MRLTAPDTGWLQGGDFCALGLVGAAILALSQNFLHVPRIMHFSGLWGLEELSPNLSYISRPQSSLFFFFPKPLWH